MCVVTLTLQEIDDLISGGLTADEELDVQKELDALLSLELPSVPTAALPDVVAADETRQAAARRAPHGELSLADDDWLMT